MSLAMYAAPIENDEYSGSNDNNIINKKKQSHNKTQKRCYTESFDQNKVNSVLEQIHNNLENNDGNHLDDFNPPSNPISSGVERTITNEQMQNRLNDTNKESFKMLGRPPVPNNEYGEDKLDLNGLNTNYGDFKNVDDYYKKYVPNYDQVKNYVNRRYYNGNTGGDLGQFTMNGQNNDILLQKINYMINLLEEQQDEKTGNVTEEVVLYSFLGIFIIFVLDSFSKIGKYVR
jgi:hypothetical protein